MADDKPVAGTFDVSCGAEVGLLGWTQEGQDTHPLMGMMQSSGYTVPLDWAGVRAVPVKPVRGGRCNE